MPSPFDSAQRRADLSFAKAQAQHDADDDRLDPDDGDWSYDRECEERMWRKADADYEWERDSDG